MKTEENQYKETIQSLREERMDWNFEEFTEKTKAETPQEKPKLIKSPRFFWLAACVILLLGVGMLIQFGNEKSTEKKDLLVRSQILKEKERFQQESSFAVNILADSAKVKKDSIFADSATALEPVRESDLLDQILPRRGRLRKETPPKYAAADPETKLKNRSPKNNNEYQSTFVIINGQRIENEQEAIDLTKYSFRILSENVSKTVAQTDVIQNFNNDY